MRSLSFVLFLFICSLKLHAQINPPDFNCISNDTLFWDLPTNSCGPFLGYVIYTSNNEAGPYSILDFVTDINQDFYEDPNPNGTLTYYYLKSDYDCPGEACISSDTLNNRPPQIGPIIRVSAEELGGVLIEWNPSPSPETSAYIIYRVEDSGTFPIDTVFGANNYIDTSANENSGPESYFVVALDACNKTSIFGDSHTSIYLNSNLGLCSRDISLSWNNYDSWEDGVSRQEVWLAVGSGPTVKIADLDALQNTYLFESAIDNTRYQFYIRAFQNGNSTIFSQSNILDFVSDISEPIRELSIYSICSNSDSSVEIQWQWNVGAELLNSQLEFMIENSELGSSNLAIGSPLNELNSFTETQVDASNNVYSFVVRTEDTCGDLSSSNFAKNILVEANVASTSSNEISWTAFEMDRATLISYELYRTNNGQELLIANIEDGSTFYTDIYDPLQSSDQFCYHIIARAQVDLIQSGNAAAFIKSNKACVEKATYAITPNAFAPYGKNSSFKPVLFNTNSLGKYTLNVWDRWGTNVFTSNLPQNGWNGKSNGRDLPQGVYIYSIKLELRNGEEILDRGNVLLLR